jgi:hypothetical protein
LQRANLDHLETQVGRRVIASGAEPVALNGDQSGLRRAPRTRARRDFILNPASAAFLAD